jgi:hypothetical protein
MGCGGTGAVPTATEEQVPEPGRLMDKSGAGHSAGGDSHNAGGDNEYWWWYINKLTDVYFVPGRYTPLFGYERSATFPNGHRNIIHAYRNIPIVKFHFHGDVPEYWSTYEAASRDMVENETQLLYDDIRRTGGIAISHTSGTNMGTDWRDNDRDLEPVVEIYQGCRTNYEHEGAPRSAKAPAQISP